MRTFSNCRANNREAETGRIYGLKRANLCFSFEDESLHTENFILVDTEKHIRGIYNGLNRTSVNQLIADIKTLQKERKSI